MLKAGCNARYKIDANKIGENGVKKLKEMTPKDTGLTSESWSYEIVKTKNGFSVEFHNSNIQNGCAVAILIDSGHASRNGSWVEGKHFISPIMEELIGKTADQIFDEIKKGA